MSCLLLENACRLQCSAAHVQKLTAACAAQINPALTGGCFSLGISTILTVGLSLIFPQHYDWVGTRTLAVFNDQSKDVRPCCCLSKPAPLVRSAGCRALSCCVKH